MNKETNSCICINHCNAYIDCINVWEQFSRILLGLKLLLTCTQPNNTATSKRRRYSELLP